MADGVLISNSETADNYGAVLAQSGRWRIVRCRQDLQFIVQRRRPKSGGSRKWPWEATAYVLTAWMLPAVLQRPSMGIPAADRASLLQALGGQPLAAAATETATDEFAA